MKWLYASLASSIIQWDPGLKLHEHSHFLTFDDSIPHAALIDLILNLLAIGGLEFHLLVTFLVVPKQIHAMRYLQT